MAKYDECTVQQVENGFLVVRDGTWVAPDLDSLLDVLHTVFEQGEGLRGAPFVVDGAGPSPVEEAGVEGEDAPSLPPATEDADVPTETTIEEALAKYPAFVRDAATGRYSMMCPEHGSHTATIQGTLLVCTGRSGGKWCKQSIPMALVRVVVGGEPK